MLTTFFQTYRNRLEWLALFFLTVCIFVSQISVSMTTITYLLAFFFILISGDWKARWQRIKNNPAVLSFWIILALFIIGIFYSTSIPHNIWHDLQKRHWMLITPFLIAVVYEDHWRQKMMNAFLCVMIITLLIGFVLWFLPPNYLPFFKMNVTGDRVNPFMGHIIQSVSMCIAAFICAYRFLFQTKFRAFYFILFVLMGINIMYLSLGRTGYGIFCVMLCYLGLIRFGWKGFLSGVVLCAIILSALFFGSSHFRHRTEKLQQHYTHYSQLKRSTSIGQRIEMYRIAEKMILARPWFGYGTGGIQTALPKMIPAQQRIYNPRMTYVESIYLNFLLEFGVCGFTVFLFAMMMQIKTTFQLPHEYRCLMQMVLISILLGGIFNMFFESFPVMHLYSIFAVICFSALQKNINSDGNSGREPRA